MWVAVRVVRVRVREVDLVNVLVVDLVKLRVVVREVEERVRVRVKLVVVLGVLVLEVELVVLVVVLERVFVVREVVCEREVELLVLEDVRVNVDVVVVVGVGGSFGGLNGVFVVKVKEVVGVSVAKLLVAVVSLVLVVSDSVLVSTKTGGRTGGNGPRLVLVVIVFVGTGEAPRAR